MVTIRWDGSGSAPAGIDPDVGGLIQMLEDRIAAAAPRTVNMNNVVV